MRWSGEVWRVIPADGHPLDAGYILEASGRWNRQGEYGCLYTSEAVETAIAESQVRRAGSGISPGWLNPRVVAEIHVESESILDLGDPTELRSRQLHPSALVLPPPAGWGVCQAIADLAREEGFAAIRSPSAALPGAFNLNIYLDRKANALHMRATGRSVPLSA